MVTRFRGDFAANDSHCICKLFVLTGYTVDSSITPETMNHATDDDFYTSLSSALECVIWQIWHRKVRARDA